MAGLLDEVVPGAGLGVDRTTNGGKRRPAATAPADLLSLERPQRRGRIRHSFWTLGILLLVAALVAQAAWWERGRWFGDPRLRAVAEGICADLGCELPMPRLAGTIEILQPTLGEHPLRADVLRFIVTLINRAPVFQRLPLLQLELYDKAGVLAAARRLAPNEYLTTAGTPGIGAGKAVNVMLDIAVTGGAPAGFRVGLF